MVTVVGGNGCGDASGGEGGGVRIDGCLAVGCA